jgi:PIN domain nuclease of toxin-antitoxin system
MKYLLDTHTFLWWNLEDPQLSPQAKEIIANGKNEIYLSAASAWEIAIKAAKGRLILPDDPTQYIADRMNFNRFQSLSVKISHACLVYQLPLHHNDPFDRLLIAQSQAEALPLLSGDVEISQYQVDVIW